MEAFAHERDQKKTEVSDIQTGPMTAAPGPSPEVVEEMRSTATDSLKKGKKSSKGKKKKKGRGKKKS